MISMKIKKSTLTVSILLVLLGFMFFLASNIVVAISYDELAGEPKTLSWETAGNFSSGEKLMITMTQGLAWSLAVDPEDRSKIVELEICDPKNGTIKIELVYFLPIGNSPGDPLSAAFARVVENRSDCLQLDWNETVYHGIAGLVVGTVNFDGIYRAKVVDLDPPGSGDSNPPGYFALRKVKTVLTKPYNFLFYFGAASILIGFLVIARGSMLKRTSPRVKMKYMRISSNY